MTKLYCPKGHEVPEPLEESLKDIKVKFKNHKNQSCTQWLFFCEPCNRPYLGCDISKKEKRVNLQDIVPPLKVASILFRDEKDSNSVESHQIKDVDDANVVESKVTTSETQRKYCMHIWNYPDIASNSKGICTKCGATTDEITALPLDKVMQWVNPKRESQIAIDRVVQALDKLSDFHMFNELKNVLKEFKK